MALGDLIPPAMLAVLVVGVIAGLFGRAGLWAMLASAALFVLSLWFPVPGAAEETARLHLHWFPVSLLLLIVTLPSIAAAMLIGLLVRVMVRSARGECGPSRPVASLNS